MVTKLCIVCLCVTASSMFGLMIVRHKQGRIKYFDSAVRLTEKLISDVSFRRENLVTVLSEFSSEDKSELKKHIDAFIKSPYENPVISGKLLKPEEKRLLKEYFSSLGVTDTQTQISELNSYKSRFEQIYNDENEKFKKSGSLSLKLSVLIGLAVGVLIL